MLRHHTIAGDTAPTISFLNRTESFGRNSYVSFLAQEVSTVRRNSASTVRPNLRSESDVVTARTDGRPLRLASARGARNAPLLSATSGVHGTLLLTDPWPSVCWICTTGVWNADSNPLGHRRIRERAISDNAKVCRVEPRVGWVGSKIVKKKTARNCLLVLACTCTFKNRLKTHLFLQSYFVL